MKARGNLKTMEAVHKTILILLLLLIFPYVTEARALYSNTKAGNQAASLTPSPNKQYQLHDVGKIAMTITNFGTFGTGALSSPLCDGEVCPSCEYPKDSDINYLFLGAIWIGAVVGQDTLVSVGADAWFGGINELLPDAGAEGAIVTRSNIPGNPYYSPEAVSNLEHIVVCTDTVTDQSFTGIDPFDNRPHIPLNIAVYQTSYSWEADSADDFILFENNVVNIGDLPLNDAWIGILIDGDVHHHVNEATGFTDDICGFRQVTGVPDVQCIDEDSSRLAWISDNDGDPVASNWSTVSSRGAIGLKIHDVWPTPGRYNFNWWVSNGTPSLDFGPRKAVPFRPFNAHLGTPTGDKNKYYVLSNPEFDYDQLFTCLSHTGSGYLGPPSPSVGSDIANGYDAMMLYSFGPFDINPGASVKFYFSIVMGGNFHVNPNDFNNSFDPMMPYVFYNKLDFEDFGMNALFADWVYDNPGYDTDGDFYSGKYCWYYIWGPNTATPDPNDSIVVDSAKFYYTGDGVPDIRLRLPSDAEDDNMPALPNSIILYENYPNPFNPSTRIDYFIPRRGHVNVTIYNIVGQRVATIVDEVKPAGKYSAIWDGRDSRGRPAASGIYLYSLKIGDFIESRKMILLR